MENSNEKKKKNEETRIIRLRFEEILHILLAYNNENIEERAFN